LSGPSPEELEAQRQLEAKVNALVAQKIAEKDKELQR